MVERMARKAEEANKMGMIGGGEEWNGNGIGPWTENQ
jgi:hypothetical protein